MASRVGIDIGGTFTDLVYYDAASGNFALAKVPSTPAAPDRGALNALRDALSGEQIGRVELFLHGMTVGLNALLERDSAHVGLLATEGFRDILEIRRGGRVISDPLFGHYPAPLVPRELRLAVGGRIKADGTIYRDLDRADIESALVLFQAHGVNSIAIAFINAYANPAHELEAERVLREAGFSGRISLSHQVSGEYREYERTTTTVVDAFVGNRVTEYLQRLEDEMKRLGFKGASLITRSGSGSMTFAEAARRPFETIMSGPVAGAEGAAELARTFKLGDLVTADVGGTSFDTALIVDGRPELLYQGEIMGLPLQTAWVDVHSIGSGGGSIAYVDEGGLLRVGPQSAGADPGPACYGRGGCNACTTDAAFHLGMLGKGAFRSGLTLNAELARNALQLLGERLDKSIDDVAQGIMTIAAAAMSNAIRELTVDRGIDPGSLSLVAFGGGGGMMATLIAGELNIKHIIIPPFAGNFSAWGLLGADLIRTRSRTRISPLDEQNLVEVNELLALMFAELGGEDDMQISDGLPIRQEVSLDLRYEGQEYTLNIPVVAQAGRITSSAAEILGGFVTKYTDSFGGTLEVGAEIVSLRATLRQPLPPRPAGLALNQGTPEQENASIRAFSFVEQGWRTFRFIEREYIKKGEVIRGPAIINEHTSTTYVDLGFEISNHESGCLFIKPVQQAAVANAGGRQCSKEEALT